MDSRKVSAYLVCNTFCFAEYVIHKELKKYMSSNKASDTLFRVFVYGIYQLTGQLENISRKPELYVLLKYMLYGQDKRSCRQNRALAKSDKFLRSFS